MLITQFLILWFSFQEREGHGADKETDSTKKRDKDDVENKDYDDDDDDGDEDEDGGDVEVSDAEKKQQRRVSHGFHLVEGKMKHGMEDYLVAENRKMDGHDLGLYAIFDGHSGRKVAEYLQSHLFENILSEVCWIVWPPPRLNVLESIYLN